MFKGERTLRTLTYFWSFVTMVFLVVDFVAHERYGFLFNYLSVIYLGILSLYAGTKEFNRWKKIYNNKRHPGEWFVIIWTILIFILFVSSGILNKELYKLSSEAMSVYIGIITIFGLTQRPKYLYRKKYSQN